MPDPDPQQKIMRWKRERANLRGEIAHLKAALHATDVARLHAERELAIMRDTANLLMDRIEEGTDTP